ncbi:MAG TPA: Uma2 family endonuclease [Candidatus Elarobacter sp.]|nr:Uma2 family endonuclease [Candidatus Elarobacter sp.]
MKRTTQREIVLPETKPETEWLRGRAVKKMSPERTHAVLRLWFARRLDEWAGERGIVGIEWRFRVAPPGEDIRPLVPDISYLGYDRIGDETEDELEVPLIPPTVAIEIRSPGDNRRDVEAKVDVFVRAGAGVVIVVNPKTRTVIAQDAAARRIFWGDETFEHPAVPGFTFALPEMFDALRLRHPS